MRKLRSLAAFLTLCAGASNCVAADKDRARVPVLLELFTSEGCSSCPPADRLLEVLDQKQPVSGAELIVLSEHVDYWDHLGWRDPFSSPQFTARQQEYSSKFGRDGVYNQVTAHIELPSPAQNAKRGKAVLYLAIADNKVESYVRRGENEGRNLTHVGVVRVMRQVGTIDLESAFAKDVTLSAQQGNGSNGMRLVAFLKNATSGEVLGVAVQKI